MRTLRKNQIRMYYSLQLGMTPKYVRDEEGNIKYESYIDTDGNEIFMLDSEGKRIPLDTGETEILYGLPVGFMASFSMSGGEAEAREFGLDISSYDGVILVQKDSVPIVEGSLIWVESEVAYEDSNKTKIKVTSADYTVVSVRPSLNFIRCILKRNVR